MASSSLTSRIGTMTSAICSVLLLASAPVPVSIAVRCRWLLALLPLRARAGYLLGRLDVAERFAAAVGLGVFDLVRLPDLEQPDLLRENPKPLVVSPNDAATAGAARRVYEFYSEGRGTHGYRLLSKVCEIPDGRSPIEFLKVRASVRMASLIRSVRPI